MLSEQSERRTLKSPKVTTEPDDFGVRCTEG